MNEEKTKNIGQSIELATFYVGQAVCGMDILQVQEINKIMERTPVPQAPAYVLGILNLRGRIVTIIDLTRKIGLGEVDQKEESRNIVVNTDGGTVGFLVSGIGDVIGVSTDMKEEPPANMQGIQGHFFSGVFKTEKALIGFLDIEKVMAVEE